MFKFLFFLSLLFFSLNSFGSSNAPQEFSDGINSYKQKNYKEAQSIFTKIASEHPNNVTNLYNLGLTEAKLGRPGVAAAFWRKVLNLQPHYSLARKSFKSIELFFHKSFVIFLYSVFPGVWSHLYKIL